MSKKTIFIITTFLILVAVGLFVYYFLLVKPAGDSGQTESGGFRSFFSFGGNSTTPTTTPQTLPQQVEQKPQKNDYLQKLRKLSSEPVAGAGVIDAKAGTLVRHIEKATGHIFETELFSANQNRISNTTIPLAYDAIWSKNGSSLVAQYLKDDNQTVDTYSLTLAEMSTTTESTISGVSLPANISSLSILDSSLFYLVNDTSGSSGYVSSIDGAKRRLVWQSPLKEIIPQYVNTKTIALTTKPEENIPGHLYFIDSVSGQSQKIVGNILDLSTLTSPDATQVLLLGKSTALTLYSYSTISKTFNIVTPTTFPEKCVWSKKDKNTVYCAVPQEYVLNNGLISWYKGLVSYTDDIWKYDLKNNTSSIIEKLSDDSGEAIDVVKPILSDGEQYLVFINKRDGALWSLDLTK